MFNVSDNECVIGITRQSYYVYPASEQSRCATLAAASATSKQDMYIAIGGSIGALAIILIIVMIARRKYYAKPKIIYIRIPTNDHDV